jgi:hypothetical protein
MSVKSDLTCSFCKEIFKNPYSLPCGDSLCEEHLNEPNIRKKNAIKCKICQKVFTIKDNEMIRPNTAMQKLVEKERYLSDEEKIIKNNLEESLDKLLHLNAQLQQAKNDFDLECHNRFAEIHIKIKTQRDELKRQIDKISSSLIEQTKRVEAWYSKNLNQFKCEAFDLETEKKSLNETFRDANLKISTIEQLQLKQDTAISIINSKLNEINEMKNSLKISNDFKPNLLLDLTSFGSLSLSVNLTSSFESQIIDKVQLIDLIQICEFNLNDKWTLLYRGTRDGFGAKDFHSKCDGKSPTLTIIKAQGSEYIFGAYTEASWKSSCIYELDPHAFLFSLKNKENKPCKMKCVEPYNAIECNTNYGPIFGGSVYGHGDDIRIANNSNVNENSHSQLGDSYKHSEYEYKSLEAQTFLAGSFEFQVSEIEVFIRN